VTADAQYEVYTHPESGASAVRTLGYSLPRELLDHINVVTPTTYFSTLRSLRATSFVKASHTPVVDDGSVIHVAPGSDATVPSSCSSTITPACLRALYNTSSYTPAATTKNSLGIAGYLEEYANDADLQVTPFISCGQCLRSNQDLRRRSSRSTAQMRLGPSSPMWQSTEASTTSPIPVQRPTSTFSTCTSFTSIGLPYKQVLL
jgi:hypothetical protein